MYDRHGWVQIKFYLQKQGAKWKWFGWWLAGPAAGTAFFQCWKDNRLCWSPIRIFKGNFDHTQLFNPCAYIKCNSTVQPGFNTKSCRIKMKSPPRQSRICSLLLLNCSRRPPSEVTRSETLRKTHPSELQVTFTAPFPPGSERNDHVYCTHCCIPSD